MCGSLARAEDHAALPHIRPRRRNRWRLEKY